MASYDPAKAVAWIAEETGDPTSGEDSLVATGLFFGHIESDELGDGFENGPELVPAQELIDWARERAGRVIVRICGGNTGSIHYSAGEEHVVWDGQPLPEWPAEGLDLARRRLPGWEHVDRTEADPPIEWDVLVRPLQGVGKPVPGFASAFAEELMRQPDITVVGWESRRGGGVIDPDRTGFYVAYGEGNPAAEALVRLRASTLEEAEQTANRSCLSATARVLATRSLPLDTEPLPWTSEADAYPTGSRAAEWNAKLGAGPGQFV